MISGGVEFWGQIPGGVLGAASPPPPALLVPGSGILSFNFSFAICFQFVNCLISMLHALFYCPCKCR
eukprot:9546582-Karenia_brevis.AAC.1